jgi:hypothetical protein
LKLTCSRHDIAEKLLNWRSTTITDSEHGHPEENEQTSVY